MIVVLIGSVGLEVVVMEVGGVVEVAVDGWWCKGQEVDSKESCFSSMNSNID